MTARHTTNEVAGVGLTIGEGARKEPVFVRAEELVRPKVVGIEDVLDLDDAGDAAEGDRLGTRCSGRGC